MKSLMQHNATLARAAWLPLVLASGACSMDMSLGDMSQSENGLVDDGTGAVAPSTIDGAVASRLPAPEVTFATAGRLWGQPVVATDLDSDGHDDLAVATYDVATGIYAVHVRYGGPRPNDAKEAFAFAEGGARLLLPASDARLTVFAAGDVDGDGYGDLFVSDGLCDGPAPERGGYLIYGGPERLDGVADIGSASTHFSPPPSTGDGSSCAFVTVTAPGDLDGDGLSDLVFVYPGAPESWESEPTIASGLPGIYVFYGRTERFGANVPWTSADARVSSTLSGNPEREQDYISVRAVGDLNGDGGAELIVSYWAWGLMAPSPDEPAMRLPVEQILVPGGERLANSVDLTALPLRHPGLYSQEGEGPLGDLDGDGFDDIIMRFDSDYLLFYGAADLLDAPLEPARAAARIVTQDYGIPHPLGDLDGDGDAELGVNRYISADPPVPTIDTAVVSGSRARLSGDITFAEPSLDSARIYSRTYAGAGTGTRYISFMAPVGDLDGDGAGDVLTESAPDNVEASASPLMLLHLHYGVPVEAPISDVPR